MRTKNKTVTEGSHTPGPWNIAPVRDRDHNAIIEAPVEGADTPYERMAVALAFDFNIYARDAERDANARLIAAAPELLDAAREALTALEMMWQERIERQIVGAECVAITRLRAAIAKAQP